MYAPSRLFSRAEGRSRIGMLKREARTTRENGESAVALVTLDPSPQ